MIVFIFINSCCPEHIRGLGTKITCYIDEVKRRNLNKNAGNDEELLDAGKVYFVVGQYDVKLQADNHVRWDVAERLNRKQTKHIGDKN
jgi:hypothetical protein